MAKFKVKLSLFSLTIGALITLARLIVTKMTLNPNFTAPDPALAQITTAANDLEAAKGVVDGLKSQLKTAVSDQDAKETILQNLLTKEGKYVELKSDGDEVKIESAGMDAWDASNQPPVGTLPKVKNLSLAHGDEAGEVDSHWHPEKKSVNYTIQTTYTDPNDPATVWTNQANPTKSSYSIHGLTSGQHVWVRVCANGSEGPGAFSDAITIIVP
jgi:hypothetical protein